MKKRFLPIIESAGRSLNEGHYPAALTFLLEATRECSPAKVGVLRVCNIAIMLAWNAAHPNANPLDVVYWPGACEGEGLRGRTRGPAYLLCGEAVVQIEGRRGAMPLSHVLALE